MKELKPITKTRFKCDFCKKVVVKKETMERHEIICYYNPNRKCPICDDSGGWGNGYDEPRELCTACEIVKEINK